MFRLACLFFVKALIPLLKPFKFVKTLMQFNQISPNFTNFQFKNSTLLFFVKNIIVTIVYPNSDFDEDCYIFYSN